MKSARVTPLGDKGPIGDNCNDFVTTRLYKPNVTRMQMRLSGLETDQMNLSINNQTGTQRRAQTFGRFLLRLLTMCVLTPVSLLYAQSITISPSGWVTAGLGSTTQYTATVTGLSNTAVYWSAGGVKGGSSVAGTISSTGLYTAPKTMPGQNPVTITATSQDRSTVTASVYINLVNPGPTLTSVTPNPIPTGAITVTLTGSGFLSGAQVMETCNGSTVMLSNSSLTATTIVATGWQAAAPSASFTVTNPGSTASNAIVVPVGSGSGSYTLTVANGTGGGKFTAGATVSISANAPPQGQSFLDWTGATVANSKAANTTLVMPAANTTVTANYTGVTYTLTVVNGTGSGNYHAGAVVPISANAPPTGMDFGNWTGATVANSTSANTTLTMPATATTVTANYSAIAPVPFPVTTHPRLWITTSDLPRLRGWATASNPIYAQGMAPLLQSTLTAYNTQFFPDGVANPTYPDDGDFNGYASSMSEQYALVLAFNSLIDPSPANRITYAKDARNLLMYVMNQAALGTLAGAPFRDPLFCQSNRANYYGEDWGLTVDWIYNTTDASGNAILTPADKATIRKVFLMWENLLLTTDATGGDHPVPVGVTNSLSLLGNGTAPYRMASNNYFLGHARMMTLLALCIDPNDDPAINPALSTGTPGNSLRSFLLDANGAWLYEEYAMMGDPQSVATDYGIPGNGAGFGIASGGMPPEGDLYGHSFGYVLGQLLALQTAGFNNVAYTGPQIHLIGSPVWDRYAHGFLDALTPNSMIPAGEAWMGPVYQWSTSGDTLRTWVTPEQMQPLALLAVLDGEQGITTHSDAARWFGANVPQGGLMYNVSTPFVWSTTQSILFSLIMDPSLPKATDPRPTYPLTFFDPAAGQISAHSDWGANPTWFDYRACWENINHQQGDGGQFEFFRNGEWLTKGMSNYDANWLGQTTMYHNTLGIKNWCEAGTPLLNWFESGEWANGSNWNLGLDQGDPSTVMSTGTGYVYASSDLTKLYNRPNIWEPTSNATDVTQANRSILWLNKDTIVIYDRATTIHPGLFKTFNLSLISAPFISGNVSTETMADGQQLFVQTLLPEKPSITYMNGAANLASISDLEPTRYVMTVQDPTLPTDARFLHVLQGANIGITMVAATYVQSTSGTPFDGAVFGDNAVFFPVNLGTVATTTFAVSFPHGSVIIAGLVPGGNYGVATTTSAAGAHVTLTPGGTTSKADSAGLLTVTF